MAAERDPTPVRATAAAGDATAALTGNVAVLEVLRGWGIERVFMCPGSTEAGLLDASLGYPEIAFTLVTHESIAISMADGFSRVTNRPSVALIHTHLGLGNSLAHLYCAQIENSPVVVLSGLKPTTIQGNSGFTTTSHIRDYARQHTKWDWQTLAASEIAADVTRALKIATSQPMGPTWVGLPQDLMGRAEVAAIPPAAEHRAPGRTRPDPASVEVAAARLRAAERPLIVAGNEIDRSDARPALIAIAERLGAPVYSEDRRTVTMAGFPTDHPHYAGIFDPQSATASRADLVLLAGARTPLRFEPSAVPLPPATPLIHMSWNAAEVAKVHPTAVPLVCDAALGLADLADALGAPAGRDGGAAFVREARAEHLERLSAAREAAERSAAEEPIRVRSLMLELARTLDESCTIVDDSVTSRSTLELHMLASGRRRYYATGGGSLGWGVGAALGIRLASPDERVVSIVGDGVFHFGVPALWTAARERIPVTYVIVNNRSYAAVRAALRRFDGDAVASDRYPGVDLAGPDLVEVARGFGVHGQRVERLGELGDALGAAGAQDGPSVIDVWTDAADSGP